MTSVIRASSNTSANLVPHGSSEDREVIKKLNDLLQRVMEYMTQQTERMNAFENPPNRVPTARSRRETARSRFAEDEEDSMLLHEPDETDDEDNLEGKSVSKQKSKANPLLSLPLTEQPSLLTATLRSYQMEGFNWLVRLYLGGLSGILADEMGLGKTIQSISLLAYLKELYPERSPHIVITPLSTLGNWARELERFCPSLRVVTFYGDREARQKIVQTHFRDPSSFDVMLTSYEVAIKEKSALKKINWHCVYIDEAHRIKNETSVLSTIVRLIPSTFRLLITGTPLQNNLHELWALLNFLLPDLFSSSHEFDDLFRSISEESEQASDNSSSKDKSTQDEKSSAMQVTAFEDERAKHLLNSLHRLLQPFMLRRLKAQVETELLPKKEYLLTAVMTDLQRGIYRSLVRKDYEAVLGTIKDRSRLLNLVMQLRKVSNHPYLFEGVEPLNSVVYGEHLVESSGKMMLLDKLLKYFKARGSRVLIFSQMTRILDILEDYCIFRGFGYCRIDGNTNTTDREENMRVYNADNSEKFCFLLSTRAGGLGINLYTADIVVLFDSDWNPQMDLQAMDRAHRIGQKRQVRVFRLVTKDTVEERIIARAEVKLRLDAMVVGGKSSAKDKKNTAVTNDELSKIVRHGVDKILMDEKETEVIDEDFETILERGERKVSDIKKEAQSHVSRFDLSFTGTVDQNISLLPDGDEPSPEALAALHLDQLQVEQTLLDTQNLGKRERKKNYDVNAYYRGALTVSSKREKSLLPKPYRIPRMLEHQFFNRERILELAEKENKHFTKYQWSDNPPALRGITDEEELELLRLISEGFDNWNTNDFRVFVNACRRFGRNNVNSVVNAFNGTKPRDEILRYHKTFFARALELKNGANLIKAIDESDKRVRMYSEFESTLEQYLKPYLTSRDKLIGELPVAVPPVHMHRGYSHEADRFLLYVAHLIGFGEWQKIKKFIDHDAEFKHDYFLRSRTVAECERRIMVLARERMRIVSGGPSFRKRAGQKAGTSKPVTNREKSKSDTNAASNDNEIHEGAPSSPELQSQPKRQPKSNSTKRPPPTSHHASENNKRKKT